MGLFDKKYCDICGEKIGLLGNRKLDDGNLCKNCAKKLSPWFEERRHSTVEDIKKQLAYREANKEAVRQFSVTREFATDTYHVYLDERQGKFAIARKLDEETNPDILDLSQVTSCRMEVDQDRHEEQYRDQDGKMRSYVPPRYRYSYAYRMKISVNSPWFDDMDFDLNGLRVEEQDRGRMMQMEQTGNEIVAVLTGRGMPGMGGMQRGSQQPGMMNQGMYGHQPMMNQGMYSQQPGMNQGMYGQQSGMYGQQPGMNSSAYPQQQTASMAAAAYTQTNGSWVCSCGATNTGRFCEFCGQPRPE